MGLSQAKRFPAAPSPDTARTISVRALAPATSGLSPLRSRRGSRSHAHSPPDRRGGIGRAQALIIVVGEPIPLSSHNPPILLSPQNKGMPICSGEGGGNVLVIVWKGFT